MKVRVEITRRASISDPEGTTVARGLRDLGYDEVGEVHMGRTIHLEVDGDDVAAVHDRVDEMCRRLLANPVIEDYVITVEESE
ncbi:MAG: phosphoribosylformylglycinamidine synthase subunit PurS [Actinobacteria bacterium]|nr:phosphoribosylformylglycinamidine synthase subunit PurS [Actinomycetota bacterium]NIS31962.1 phosphoribosylformylglycinamidine synthase subunit PurS [Actinomycetota bacterium]NIT97921.1 phosphoribosylformylglycinamidine synthase subunit PurS [Actinomycetota bacterium]NIU21565.1 phosphoribosylformylglycinamidine synthase subunit PurS [Actinomycetota bacterium]NIU67045.1 phosphoribosylformylglycinamidine synthase subunit PurS [Actinomycetota bacterium]